MIARRRPRTVLATLLLAATGLFAYGVLHERSLVRSGQVESAAQLARENAATRASETPATATATFSGNPANLDTLSIAGTTITFVTGAPSGLQVQIGATQAITIANLMTFLAASVDANLIKVSAAVAGNAAVGARTVLLRDSKDDITTFTGGLEVQ